MHSQFSDAITIVKGMVTSSVLVGGMIGSLAGGPIADMLGRRKVFQTVLLSVSPLLHFICVL